MYSGARRSFVLLAVLSASTVSYAATFGLNVAVRGTVSDLALDSGRGKVYAANFSANRVEVLNTVTKLIENPFNVPMPPSSVAISANGTFLVVGEIANPTIPAAVGGLTVINLVTGVTFPLIPLPNQQVLAVAFGASNLALVVTTSTMPGAAGQFLILDPGTGITTQLPPPTVLPGVTLPVNFGTFPPNIIQATTGISGDGQTIVIVAESANNSTVMTYPIGSPTLNIIDYVSSPPLGPIAVSVNQDASAEIVGWTLLDQKIGLKAQFPYALGNFRQGGHAWDIARNVIYADIPVALNETPVLHLMDTDNFTVRERIQLPQMMAGRSLFSSDGNTLYAISDSGILILPVSSLPTAHRVASQQEDVTFLADACNRQMISQTIQIVDKAGGNIDFNLTLPPGTAGVRLTPSSGTTPATVRIDVDPTVFQNVKGTTTIPLTLQSSAAVNIPFPVRLLINTRDENQVGRIVNVPGKIVDMLADPARNRTYLLRQDKNVVLVYDNATLLGANPGANPIPLAQLRTGNTPTGMTITRDQRYLIVGNDNSQYASVFDLSTLLPSDPILVPGAYPRSVAAANGGMWATTRPGSGDPQLFSIDFANRIAMPPASLGIYTNGPPNAAINSVLSPSPSGNFIFMAVPGFGVAMFDSSNGLWLLGRTDTASAGGAYGALRDDLFLVDTQMLDLSLFPVATLESTTGTSSGIGLTAGPPLKGLRTTAGAASAPGTIERLDLDFRTTSGATLLPEAPMLASTMMYPSIGQIGETILPFTRTMTVLSDGSSLLLTQSGITVVPSNFDAPRTIPVISQMTNAADGGSGMASGGLVLISGQGLATGPDSAAGLPLPTSLGNACFTVGNVAIPLFYVTPTQVLAELPFTVSGSAPVVARTPGGISSTFTANILNGAPAIFRTGQAGDQGGLATVFRVKNNQLVTFTNPIHPSEYLSIYLTGLGQTSPQAPLGDAAPFDPLAIANNPPTVFLGGAQLAVTFAGLAPGEVGVYLINAFVPSGVANAAQTPLVISQGASSTSIQVRVVNP